MLPLLFALSAHAACPPSGACVIMPMGDSITHGYTVLGGYRVSLSERLREGGYAVDFVGALHNGPGALLDQDHEGHPGWTIGMLEAFTTRRILTYRPDVVLLHIGTNDIYADDDLANAPDRVSTLIGDIFMVAPDCTVLLAQVIPTNRRAEEARTRHYNARLPAVADAWVADGYDVRIVDHHTGFQAWMLSDGVHPTPAGYERMAGVWYEALLDVLP